MAQAADVPEPEPAEPEPAKPDWFNQITFNPKVGLDSVLPLRLSEHLPVIGDDSGVG